MTVDTNNLLAVLMTTPNPRCSQATSNPRCSQPTSDLRAKGHHLFTVHLKEPNHTCSRGSWPFITTTCLLCYHQPSYVWYADMCGDSHDMYQIPPEHNLYMQDARLHRGNRDSILCQYTVTTQTSIHVLPHDTLCALTIAPLLLSKLLWTLILDTKKMSCLAYHG